MGLSILLESQTHMVRIYFGVVSALRMLDEGVVLNDLFDDHALAKYKVAGFSNTIYMFKKGDFEKFIRGLCHDVYDLLDFQHYLIVTQNYIIEIVSECHPTVDVLEKE